MLARGRVRLAMLAGAFALGLLSPLAPARADGGEAGLVIQNGDRVDTYCVPFSGDSITGAELLAKVNIPVVQWSGLVCAVGNEGSSPGCFHPSSFDTCVCQSFPPESTYWAFFSQKYGGQWVYSASGFLSAKARDGDMQAWKWGKGSPNSAPPPVAITFEQVCGHAPRGGQAAATEPPGPTQASPPAAATAQISPTLSQPSGGETAAPAQPSPAVAASIAATSTPGAAQPAALVTIQSHGTATATPQPPGTGVAKDGGSDASGLIAFGAIAAVLLGAIGGALVWRRHGR